MKTRYILYPLLMLLAIILPTSCSFEEDINNPVTSNGDKITLTLGVSVPGAQNVESRAFGNTNYNFSNLFVAVYERASDGSYYYQGTSPVEPVGTATHNGKTCSTYNVTLTATNNPCRLHIIANYPGLSLGLDDEGEAIGLLKTDDEENKGGHDVYWNFVELPNGITTEINNNGEIVIATAIKNALTHVPLVRNYAKVQLELGANVPDGFFKGYKLYNMPTKGTVAAYNPNATNNKFVNFVDKSYANLVDANYLGNEVYNVPLIADSDWKTITTPTYMYERKNTDTNGQLVANATYMIIKGELDGATFYYKLDFVDTDGDPYNLLRNFVYTMSITGVNGPGYATEAEAMAQPAGNNLNAASEIKDFTNISNGTEQLFVSTTSLMITQDKNYYLYYKYIPNLTAGTTSNSSVTITGDGAGTVLEEKAVNNAFGGTGEYAGWGMVTLNPKKPGAYTTQVLTFTAGNLKRTVTLTAQMPSEEMSVSLNPASVAMEAGQDVEVNITLPAALGESESLFPLRMFISSVDNTIYATSLPVEIRDGKYGFIREISYEQFTQAPTVDNKKVFSSAFKTNCAESETDVEVEHEYFVTATAHLGNVWQNSVSLGTGVGVDIEKVYGRYPQTIYANGANNGTKTGVTVKLNDTPLSETISIDNDNVTKGIEFVSVLSKANINATLSKNDVVVFEFTDKHWKGGDNWADMTWHATTTLGEIAAGTTLNFVHVGDIQKITEIVISTAPTITVVTEGDKTNDKRYPKNIYNGNEVTVSVKLTNNSGKQLGEMKIQYSQNKWTIGNITLSNTDGFNFNETIYFTFNDYYYKKNNSWNANTSAYYATCTLEALINGTANLSFKR